MKSLKVLVIGNASFSKDIEKALREMGHKVSCARDGNVGIAFIKGNFKNLNLVITDQQIPKKLGEEVIRFIRLYYSQTYNIKSVMAGNNIDDATRMVALAAGADAVIEKSSLIGKLPWLLLMLFPE